MCAQYQQQFNTNDSINIVSQPVYNGIVAGGEPPSCDSLCIGLAVGLTVGLVVVIAIVIVAVVAWRRRRQRGLGSLSTDTAVTSPNKTVIYVGSEDRSENPYSHVENAGDTQEMTDVYLHL